MTLLYRFGVQLLSKITAILAAVLTAAGMGLAAPSITHIPASAASAGDFQTEATHAILLDAKSGTVLFEKDADTPMPPASMSKLMVLAVVFRDLRAGKITLDQQFPVSEHAWRTGGAPSGTATMFAPIHSMVSVDQLIQGITVQSGNDACLILAEGIAGSEQAFIKQMNAYAKEIGLTHSNFTDVTGLPAPGEAMSARDLARLAGYLMDTYPEYYHYFGEPSFTFTKFTFRNRNPLIFDNIGVDGLKTGYTKEAGYGLVASAKQGDRRLIAVVAGLKSKQAREDDPRRLIEWGFKNFKRYRLFDPGQQVSRALVWGGTKFYVPLVGRGPIDLLLPISDDPQVTASIAYMGPVKAPIKKGQQIGWLRVVSMDSDARNQIPLYAGEDIGPSGFAMRGLDSLFVLAFGWLL
jgi:serine-type D-Ala-D-Ala carboxypeptidase (penicillin-binding protein 5/6)